VDASGRINDEVARHTRGAAKKENIRSSGEKMRTDDFDSVARFPFFFPAMALSSPPVIARCLLDQGGLTGFLRTETPFDATDFRARYFDSVGREIYLQRVESLAELPLARGRALFFSRQRAKLNGFFDSKSDIP
jgi:hypothetical protein